jgi:hypothetical protein
MLAGLIASRVLYHGDSMLSFRLQAGGFVVFFVCVIFAPLIMFTGQMARARRKGLAEYGLLAQRYVEGFREKWIVEYESNSGELLGTGDIQSLADLGNSYAVVNEMRLVPFWTTGHDSSCRRDRSSAGASLTVSLVAGRSHHASHEGRLLSWPRILHLASEL